MARTAIQVLGDNTLVSPPKWLAENTHYLVMMGSVAYGASGDSSDMDIYGWCMPPLRYIFPHIEGNIPDFGPEPQKFGVWQQHHVKDNDKEYDFAVYSIVKFFDLCMQNNPNMVDALFVPDRCVLHCTKIGLMVRDNRKMFLHKGSFHKFRGYAHAQMRKIGGKANSQNPKRQADIEKHGMDTKFAYHVARLADECEQILTTGDLDITRSREVMKSIRRGEWSLERLTTWFEQKDLALEDAYNNSTLQHKPDINAIKALLLQCLEEHYGSLSKVISIDKDQALLNELRSLVERYDR